MAESLAALEGIRLGSRESGARVGRGEIGGKKILLALPQTYMNASGEAVYDLCQRNGIDPSHLCVVFDDIDLTLGTLRMRARGSAGGQKGMASIIQSLGTSEFPRLRVGVRGGGYSREIELADYVLEPFAEAERASFEDAVGRAVEALRIWVAEGIETAMRSTNGKTSSPREASRAD